MILEIFAVYDEKAGAYLPPFFLPTVQIAKRTFGDCVNDPKHNFGRHPQDYTLFHQGEFDCDTSDWEVQTSYSLGNGVEFKTQPSDYDRMGQMRMFNPNAELEQDLARETKAKPEVRTVGFRTHEEAKKHDGEYHIKEAIPK